MFHHPYFTFTSNDGPIPPAPDLPRGGGLPRQHKGWDRKEHARRKRFDDELEKTIKAAWFGLPPEEVRAEVQAKAEAIAEPLREQSRPDFRPVLEQLELLRLEIEYRLKKARDDEDDDDLFLLLNA